MTIKVTQEHIDHGKQGHSARCPVALASREVIKDWAPSKQSVSVSEKSVVIGGLKRGQYYQLDESTRAFIVAFDFGESVAPFEFDLPL